VPGGLPSGEFLNVGSGPVVRPGWISIDGSWQARLAGHPLLARVAHAVTGREVGHWPRGILCRDVREGIGRPADTAAAIYSSHFIEHLRRDEALRFLRDCKATLKSGGVCRIVTPDLRALAGRYLQTGERTASAAEDFLRDSLLVDANGSSASGMLRWYRARTRFDAHKWLYDGSSLRLLFEEAGFRTPEVRAYLDSRIPPERLELVEDRNRIEGGAGVVVEGLA
jgi:predicted SAM-dependent methyltransferase